VSYALDAWTGEDGVTLHPVQAMSADPVVGTAAFEAATGTFTVPARTTAVFVDTPDDTTPPVVTAELARRLVGRQTGIFEVRITCVDNVSSASEVELVADINGVPVANGDRVLLIVDSRREVREGRNLTIIRGPDFTLTATCTDAAGNSATATAVPPFRG